MNWLGLMEASAAWLFLLLVPLVVLYFLKLRRPRQEWPSLALWRSVLNDQRVNSPFQRFKRNILLLLQILALCCLVLAALQPFWRGADLRARYIPVVIDLSASMAALDQAGGVTRLEVAKQRVREMIENLLSDQRLCLIAVDTMGRKLTDFTDNKRLLLKALEELQPSHLPSKLEEGLRLAQALTRIAPVEQVLVYTDGNVAAALDFELPFRLSLQKIPPGGTNVGITEVGAQRRGTGWDLFARLEGSAGFEGLIELRATAGGEEILRETVDLSEDRTRRVSFQLEGEDALSIEMTIAPDGFDSLAVDNTAYLELPQPRPLWVYCDEDLSIVRHALQPLPRLNVFPGGEGELPALYDLVLTRKQLEDAQPGRVSIHWGGIPKELESMVSLESGGAEITDWSKSSPLLQYVSLSSVELLQTPVAKPEMAEKDFEQRGYEYLAYGSKGPLILQKREAGRWQFHFLFDPEQSTLPYRVGFPVMVANAIEIATREAGLAEVSGLPTGTLPAWLGAKPGGELQVQTTEGGTWPVRASAEGVVTGVSAQRVGRYQLVQDGQTIGSRGVALLSSSETRLGTVDEIDFGEVKVGTEAATVKGDQPLWRWFALLGMGLVLLEWWWYQRRPT